MDLEIHENPKSWGEDPRSFEVTIRMWYFFSRFWGWRSSEIFLLENLWIWQNILEFRMTIWGFQVNFRMIFWYKNLETWGEGRLVDSQRDLAVISMRKHGWVDFGTASLFPKMYNQKLASHSEIRRLGMSKKHGLLSTNSGADCQLNNWQHPIFYNNQGCWDSTGSTCHKHNNSV